MSDDTKTRPPGNWLKLTPNLEHFDPFEGLTDGLPSEEELRYTRYGFRIAGQNVLVKKSIICEVIPNVYIYPIPNLPGWVLGMINLRGNLVPVINLGQLLLPEDAEYNTSRKALLVIDRGEKSMATYLDELPVALELDESVAEEVQADDGANELIREFTAVAYNIDGTTWHEIDHNGMFRKITAAFNDHGTTNDIETKAAS